MPHTGSGLIWQYVLGRRSVLQSHSFLGDVEFRQRNNVPGDTPEIYYRHTVSIPFLDELISHLKTRFSDLQQNAIMGMTLVPSVMADQTIPANSLSDLMEHYGEDLPNP